MIFQNVELLETDKFQYLLIHKNGSSSVSKCMESLDFNLTNRVNLTKMRWTVIRDPYERFISGLKYDLNRHNLNIEDIDHSELYNSSTNVFARQEKHINHTASQVPHLINTHINWYVELKDLNTFLKMHFNKIECCNSNKEDIKINLDKKQIMKHLDLDYYIYNKILNSSYLWKWQFGKIF